MANTILKRLQKTDRAMEDPLHRVQLGGKLKRAAIKAIMGGIGSDDWKAYMSLFADNVDQLNRLTVRKPDEDAWLAEARAYMVANAVCGADSTTRTSLRVDDDIDDGVSNAADAKIVDPPPDGEPAPAGAEVIRPFVIP